MCCFLWSVAVYDYVAEYSRVLYVPAPHTTEVICEVLYDSLLQWNIDEKLMPVTVDTCTSNAKAIEMIVVLWQVARCTGDEDFAGGAEGLEARGTGASWGTGAT